MPAPDDSFGATERRQSRLTVHGWPEEPDASLEWEIAYMTTFEGGNEPPVVLGAGAGRHLAWRGTVTGGVLTLYEQLGPLLREHGLDAAFADARVEAYVPAQGPVFVLADGGGGQELSREAFEREIARLDRAAPGGDRFDSAATPPPDGTRAAWLEALAARVACAEITLVERFDPDGFLEEAWSTCQSLGWRVEFLTPGTCRAPEDSLETCLVWRVAEWEWVSAPGADRLGRWRLRDRRPVAAHEVAAALPEALATWVVRATEEGIELCEALVDSGDPQFAGARLRLRAELAALGA